MNKILTLTISGLIFLTSCNSVNNTKELKAAFEESLSKPDQRNLDEILFNQKNVNGIDSIIPLAEAIFFGDIEMVKKLLDLGANPFVIVEKERYGFDFFHKPLRPLTFNDMLLEFVNPESANLKEGEVFKTVVTDLINETGKKHYESLLNKEITRDDYERISGLLLEAEQSIKNKPDDYRFDDEFLLNGALNVAVKYNDIEVIKRLIDKGADIDKYFKAMNTYPIKAAILNGNKEALKLLIDKGAKLDKLKGISLQLLMARSATKRYEDYDFRKKLNLRHDVNEEDYKSVFDFLETIPEYQKLEKE